MTTNAKIAIQKPRKVTKRAPLRAVELVDDVGEQERDGNQIAPTESVACSVVKPSGMSTTNSLEPMVSPMSSAVRNTPHR